MTENNSTPPKCPRCGFEYTYEAKGLNICPECSHEWPLNSGDVQENSQTEEFEIPKKLDPRLIP